jgi:photosynthetic reaction center cytochrome c subunit
MKNLFTGGLVALLGAALLSGCEKPPIDTVQNGYRGTGMVQVSNPRITSAIDAAQVLPTAIPAMPEGGPLAKNTFKNVQVLGDLSVGEFTRTMLAITAWVSPVQGCAYCHVTGDDLSIDKLYTKTVSRRMLQMTLHINTDWKSHVAATGVTCYTCHRGQPVPAKVWFTNPGPRQARGSTADSAGQNMPSIEAGLMSTPYDPFTPFLLKDMQVRVLGTTALPTGNLQTIKQTESTYSLMAHISKSLGVNCTFCHNSRSFAAWDQSPLQRTTAFQGIRMARDLNNAYLVPLTPSFPPERLGPLGDGPKVNCATCHLGESKPLRGAPLLKDHPVLGASVASVNAVPAAVIAQVSTTAPK